MCSKAMLGLGQLCLASGEIAEAEGLFRKALEIKPDDVETRFLLTQVGKVKAGDDNLAALAAMKDAALRSQSSIPYKKAILLNFCAGQVPGRSGARANRISGKLTARSLPFTTGGLPAIFSRLTDHHPARSAGFKFALDNGASQLPLYGKPALPSNMKVKASCGCRHTTRRWRYACSRKNKPFRFPLPCVPPG